MFSPGEDSGELAGIGGTGKRSRDASETCGGAVPRTESTWERMKEVGLQVLKMSALYWGLLQDHGDTTAGDSIKHIH